MLKLYGICSLKSVINYAITFNLIRIKQIFQEMLLRKRNNKRFLTTFPDQFTMITPLMQGNNYPSLSM